MKFSPPIPEPWTASQRGVLIGLAILLAAYAALRYALNPTFVSDPQPLAPARANDLADRIDPNTASADDLAALPMIGSAESAASVPLLAGTFGYDAQPRPSLPGY